MSDKAKKKQKKIAKQRKNVRPKKEAEEVEFGTNGEGQQVNLVGISKKQVEQGRLAYEQQREADALRKEQGKQAAQRGIWVALAMNGALLAANLIVYFLFAAAATGLEECSELVWWVQVYMALSLLFVLVLALCLWTSQAGILLLVAFSLSVFCFDLYAILLLPLEGGACSLAGKGSGVLLAQLALGDMLVHSLALVLPLLTFLLSVVPWALGVVLPIFGYVFFMYRVV